MRPANPNKCLLELELRDVPGQTLHAPKGILCTVEVERGPQQELVIQNLILTSYVLGKVCDLNT